MAPIPVPRGQLAVIVTYLDMQIRPTPKPLEPTPFRLHRWTTPDRSKYRALFRRIGAPWLWVSRLLLDDDALDAIILDPQVQIYALQDRQAIEVGMLELDFRIAGQCEIAFFGLIPELMGKGLGRWLMQQALMMAWGHKGEEPVTSVKLHSCTLDHPQAIPFYQKSGFHITGHAIEIFDDPRLTGIYDEQTAPQIPLLRADTN